VVSIPPEVSYLKCPFCSNNEDKVIDSRPIDESSVIRRRRECLKCNKRFTTYERLEEMPLTVIKKDSKREVFDRSKLLQGIVIACTKRPVSIDQIEKVVNEIEYELKDYIMEVPSSVIGEIALKKLKILDEVAYVRFASIYREFSDVDIFMKELNKLKKKE
jgi:transcriptional repressor NrdR